MSRRPEFPSIDDAVEIDKMMMQIYALGSALNGPGAGGLQTAKGRRDALAFLDKMRETVLGEHPNRRATWNDLRRYSHAVLLALAARLGGKEVTT